MNIFRVSRAFFPIVDGGARHVWGLSRAQIRRGDRVWLFEPYVRDWPEAPDGLVFKQVRVGPNRWVYRHKSGIVLFELAAGLSIRRTAAHVRPDVVHVHGDALDGGVLAMALTGSGVPIVQTLHGGLSRRRLYTAPARRLFKGVTAFIAVNAVVRDQLMDLGVPAERITVISSGIDLGRFSKDGRRERAVRDGVHVVSVGRLHAVKGYEYLIDAIRLLESRGVDVRLTIAGDGPERAALERRASGSPRIRLTGSATPDEVAALLVDGDIFALSSVDIEVQSEGSPTAVIEAMAAGLPIVCADSGGLRALVGQGENGLVVPQRSAEALANAIETLAADPRTRAAMGQRNRTMAESKDWNLVAAEVDAVYERAVRGDFR